MDDSRVQSALLGWIIALAITVSVLLRRDKDVRQKLFVVLCGNVTLYYFSIFLYAWWGEPWLERISLVLAVLLPLGGLMFFRAFAAVSRTRLRLGRLAIALGAVLIAFILHPTWLRPAVGPAVLTYVVGFMLVAILDLNVQARSAPTRVDAARMRYLFGGGLVVLVLQVVERLGHVFDLDLPPLGIAITLLYLYIISQAIVRYRILDFYEMLGRFAVMTAMGVALAGIYTALVFWAGPGFTFNAFLASLVILLLFDPLRDLVERKIADFFFGERRVLEQKTTELKQSLAHEIRVENMVEILLAGLEDSRRVTQAGLYLIDPHGRGFDLRSNIGPPPVLSRVEAAVARRHLKPYASGGTLSASGFASRRDRLRREGRRPEADQLNEVVELLGNLGADALVLVEGEEQQLLGFLTVRDDRVHDAFSAEDVNLLAGLAGQIAITVENSQAYQQMKERDRLAALGEMSAGLAHEIRNPLGAIKAAAQVIEEMADDGKTARPDREFLSVIVEEVDRLNRVVTDFLSYARPSSGLPKEVDVNEILKRTLGLFEAGRGHKAAFVVDYGEELPGVVIDGERLHQVFLNLVINANQAMEEQAGARLEISTRIKKVRRLRQVRAGSEPQRFVEIRFSDNGPGIEPAVLQRVFIPFFTTKTKGAGLGLSVCQRIIRDAGGDIEVRSQVGQGTIFTVVLPACGEERASIVPLPAEDADA
ncbi:MAG: ATP-binding protein [Proteobacteria bacterium]|jgi:nitrogen-specific signal transduction histidine kinase|nr:ATP-binding protein [Pseudomonadota bacterium]